MTAQDLLRYMIGGALATTLGGFAMLSIYWLFVEPVLKRLHTRQARKRCMRLKPKNEPEIDFDEIERFANRGRREV